MKPVSKMALCKKTLLSNVIARSVTSKMERIKHTARIIYIMATKYASMGIEYSRSDMENFIRELLALNVGLTNINASGLIVDIADIRESLSYSIPDLLQLLQNTMPDNLGRISDIDWRNLFGIGIEISSPDSSPPSTDASR